MFINIEIPDKIIGRLSDLTGVPNDQNFEANINKYYADFLFHSLREQIRAQKQTEINALIDAEIIEGEIKPTIKE